MNIFGCSIIIVNDLYSINAQLQLIPRRFSIRNFTEKINLAINKMFYFIRVQRLKLFPISISHLFIWVIRYILIHHFKTDNVSIILSHLILEINRLVRMITKNSLKQLQFQLYAESNQACYFVEFKLNNITTETLFDSNAISWFIAKS